MEETDNNKVVYCSPHLVAPSRLERLGGVDNQTGEPVDGVDVQARISAISSPEACTSRRRLNSTSTNRVTEQVAPAERSSASCIPPFATRTDYTVPRFDNGIGPDWTCVLTVPSGTLIAMAVVTPTRMLRWSFSGDDRDIQVVKYTLQHFINEFPELKGGTPGYAEFARHLNLQT